MIALAETGGVIAAAPAPEPQPETPARPEWLPENFSDGAALAKSYKEAQAALTKAQQDLAALKKGTPPQAGQEGSGADGAEGNTQPAKLDWQAFQEAYAASGEVSADHYAAFEAAGIPKAAIDRFIAGQAALDAQFAQEVYSLAGGEEVYGQLQAWAKANVPDAERQAYDHLLDTGSPEQVKLAVQGMVAKWKSAGGGHSFVEGNTTNTGSDVYQSWAQVEVDMNDPRYAKDPAFRSRVEQKLGRSPI
jgi:hypothetical protein